MVLDNLGDSLKRTIKKIANAVHVDAQLVKEVVRDIQRALLQSDVNVKLVLELSKKIEQRALEEKPPAGMTNREHVIHIVYDELVHIVGASRELAIRKQVIMMVGLYGQGKCIHGDSNIVLRSGDIVTAEQLYSSHKERYAEEMIYDGSIIDISQENLFVPSFNPISLRTENKKVTHLWRLNGKPLINVFLDAGNDCSVKVTPEHPFFILRDGSFLQVRADQLQSNDFIAVPREYTSEETLYDFINVLKMLDFDIYLTPDTAKSCLSSQYSTLKTALHKYPYKRNYCKFTTQLKNGRIPLFLVSSDTQLGASFNIKSKTSRKRIQFPRFLTVELAEFIGYFIGDGHLADGYIEISNADTELVERIKTISLALFGIRPTVKKDKRNNVFKILITSKTLTEIFIHVFEFKPGKKGPYLKIPSCLLTSSNEHLSRFLRAYFDCDGSICKDYRNVEITSESKILIKQVNLLLRRFGIFSCVSIKTVHAKPYWKLCIEARYAEIFSQKIDSLLERKRVRLSEFSRIGKYQGCGKQDMIPLGNLLQNLRDALGFSIGSIRPSVSSYNIYEEKGKISREKLSELYDFYSTEKQGRMLEILNLVKKEKNLFKQHSHGEINAVLYYFSQKNYLTKNVNKFSITEKGEQALLTSQFFDAETALAFLGNLKDSHVCWVKLRRIESVASPQYVYDLTVEDNHSFIANGVFVHNTTSCGKLATYFKRKGLRPALIAGDVHRPAAYEQLKQISEQVEVLFYGDKNEKNAVNVIKEGLNKFKRTADVIIVDTSGRHKLEADLISEMKNIFKAIKPDEKLLVMDAAMGQQAGPQARAFNDAIGITGIVLTKLDGTAKGGGALSAAAEVGAPIVFVGTGEHSADFEKFDPSGFISRLLGMGDIKSLLERAEESLKGKDAEKTARKLMSGKFNLNDMYEQMNMISGMGPLSKLAEMLPGGMSGKLKNVDMDETQNKLKKFRIIMDSMTNEERENPELIQASRIKRIARGAGAENKDVKEVLKYYNMTKRMMKGFSSDRKMRRNLMRQLDFGK